jgi:hypothetical protein
MYQPTTRTWVGFAIGFQIGKNIITFQDFFLTIECTHQSSVTGDEVTPYLPYI